MIPHDLMSSENTNKAELRISPQREKRKKGLIHLSKEKDREREALSPSASLLSQLLGVFCMGMVVAMQTGCKWVIQGSFSHYIYKHILFCLLPSFRKIQGF